MRSGMNFAVLYHTIRVNQNIVMLSLVAVAVVPGVTALMGPSGAGKSTLMDIMAMRRKGGEGTKQDHRKYLL